MIPLIIVLLLVVTILLCSQDITLSKGKLAQDEFLTVHLNSNVPCKMYVLYCSDVTCREYETPFSMGHDAIFPTNEGCMEVELIFVGITGKIKVLQFCLDK